ncbi:helix-turn-helix transcriptional regulator [Rhizobium paknamense]|uniref:AraC-like DNA-binding protein n=1 Tax=Rhizobium paknamense TaxID=1206817 RepID=A0ABU0IA54_9HYPH|nr:AraC family transcriptional regulator [Rhizobium paknamense]MDQ0454161.1 AraC-like DNA-binding protein [Rhizobium paknamense]
MSTVSNPESEAYAAPRREECVRFWRDTRLGGLECMSAHFVTHRFSPHAHESFGIGAMEEGRKVATIRGVTEHSGPGDLYLINPEAMHDGGPDGGAYRYRMIYPDTAMMMRLIEELTGRPVSGTPFFPRQKLTDPALAEAFLSAHQRLEAGGGRLEAEEVILRLLAAILGRHAGAPLQLDKSLCSRAAETARDYLEAHFAEDISLDRLAALGGISRAHLIRSFRKLFHITPHAYQTHLRIRQAKALLRQGERLAEAGFACGFSDQAHFTRAFKALSGMTPGLYRAAAG